MSSNNNQDFFRLKDSRYVKKHLESISHFISFTDLEDTKKQLLDMLYAAMNSEYVDDMDSEGRSDLMSLYILLLNLIESIHWLALPVLEKFEYPLPPGLRKECPYCSSKIDLEYDKK